MDQIKYDRYFMKVAVLTSELSCAEKKKVGCILVRDNRICAIGFNGQPSGFDNRCEYFTEDGSLKTYDTVIHAEVNAVYWCAKHSVNTAGSTVFITLSPCKHCALALIQAGVSRVVYLEEYGNSDKSGLELLKIANIKVEQLNI